MIIAARHDAIRYACIHPGFAAAFDFLARPDLGGLPDGRHEVAAGVAALISHTAGRLRDQAPLEAHRLNIDIQAPIEEGEEIGWSSRSECSRVRSPYSGEKDIEFFDDAPRIWFPVTSTHFAIFFPEDAHAPAVATGVIHKVVIKVRIC